MKNIKKILYAFLAMLGILVFVFSSILLIGKIIDTRVAMPSFVVLIFVCLMGIIFTLIGLEKLKEWMYSLVFITFPLSFWIWALINPKMFGGILPLLIFIGLAAYGALRAVQYYYSQSQNKS